MKISIGTENLDAQTWQDPFNETTVCVHCSEQADIACVVREDGDEEKMIYNLHENNGKGKTWAHDSCAIATYLCRSCLKATALLSQA